VTDTTIHATDWHTGGEPFRIVTDPPVPLPGSTVAERRMLAAADPSVRALRETLCFEPRGHADMYGGFITPPNDAGADFGVLFWHKDGFSTACGHGTIALGAWAVSTGLVATDPSGVTDVVIDVPSGRVTARVHTFGTKVTSVDFINVPSWIVGRDVRLGTSLGEVTLDVGFGGAIYAQLDAAQVGLTVEPHNVQALIAIGREIKWALNESEWAQHPTDDRLSGIYGTIIYDRLGRLADGRLHQRNVTIFADGEVDRSPCGSGTAARVAVLDALGELAFGETLVHDSIVGSRFTALAVSRVAALSASGTGAGADFGATPAGIIPQITGTAFKTGDHTFVIDPDDDLLPGFVLR
jgi:proline racemase